MTTIPRPVAIAVVLMLSSASPALAQRPTWGHATGLAVSGGVTREQSSTQGLAGAAVLWELTSHFAIEGTGRWMDRGPSPDAYSGELSVLVGFGGTRDTAVPYVLGGVGLYRRTFESDRRGPAPEYYRRRFTHGGMMFGPRESFTDPTLVLGTGVDIALTRNVVVRPDLRGFWAMHDGRRHGVGVFTVSVGYRFEHRPVTPARRSR